MTVRHTDDICLVPHTKDPERARRALDGKYACDGCCQQLDSNLRAAPNHYAQLGRNLATGGTGSERVSGTTTVPLPINLAIAAHRDHLRGVLVSWSRLVIDERGITGPATGEVDDTAPFLLRHAGWAAGHRWIDEFAVEIRQAAGRARRLLDPSGAKQIRIGPCPETGCAGMLHATVRAEDDDRGSLIYCDGCEFEKPPEEWLRFGKTYLRQSGRMAS